MRSKHVFEREGVEWTHLFWENAHDPRSPRIALVGDSITFNYRDRVQELIADHGVKVDMLAGSRCAGDPALEAELEYFFGPDCGYDYDVIHFNNGLHGECNNTKIPNEIYAAGYERCIKLLRRLQPRAAIILATSTHISPEGVHGVIDVKGNANVIARNDIVRALADKYGFAVSDLFSVVAGKASLPQLDGIHFGPEGVDALARAVCDVCLGKIKPASEKRRLPSARAHSEWVRFWWADANDIEKPRIAVIGDYSALAYYQSVQDSVWGENVRLCSSIGSRRVTDPALFGELEYFFGSSCGYRYEVIYIDTMTSDITPGADAGTLSLADYGRGVDALIRALRKLQPDARLIFAVADDAGGEIDAGNITEAQREVIRQRSAYLCSISADYGFETMPSFPISAGASVPPYGFRAESDAPQMLRTRAAVSELALGLSEMGKTVKASGAQSADEMIPNKAY